MFQCSLRWSDMDAFGHVNNVVFLRYLEEARIDLMFRLAGEAAEAAADAGGGDVRRGQPSFTGGSVVARHQIDYLRPLVHRHQPITIETWVTKVGGASATLAYEIKDGHTVYARASTVIVPFDMAHQRPRRLTPTERSFLATYVDDQAGSAAPA